MKIIWTGLPVRNDDEGLLLSVYVTPRLEFPPPQTNGVLAEFDRVRHWPDFLDQLSFQVEFAGGPTLDADFSPVDPQWWEKLFTDDTPVNPYPIPDHSQTLVHSFPVNRILQFVHTTYGHLAAQSATDFPQRSTLEGLMAEVMPATFPQEFRRVLDAELERTVPGTDGTLRRALPSGFTLPGLSGVATDFLRARRYYTRPESRQPYMDADSDMIPKRPEVPPLSFHEILTFLADAPQILRMLGLVVDLRIPVDPVAAGVPATGRLRVVPSRVDPGVDLRPRTSYRLDGDRFQVAPRKFSLIEDGTLRLDFEEELFAVYQVDVDGAALKLIDFTGNLNRMGALPSQTSPTPDQASVPSLRSGGFTIAAFDRAVDLVGSLDDSSLLNTDLENDNVDLGTEDVMRGYRLDVQDVATGEWFSLHRRVGEHDFLGHAAAPPDTVKAPPDEGYVKATTASSSRVDVSDPADPNQPPPDDLYVHEALFGWDGWSLAAPRPGKVIVEPGEGEDPAGPPIASEPQQPHPELPLVSRYRVEDGSLPRLRFGRTYRFRARAVDLAGNSHPFTRRDINEFATKEHRYLRYEPVTQPAVVRRHPDTEGESLEHLVIRSNFNRTTSEYIAEPDVVAALAGKDHDYFVDSRRHLAPPKGSVQMAELHGLFDRNVLPGGDPDGAYGPAGDPAEAFRVALKEEGTFFDTAVVDVATGQKSIDVSSFIEPFPPGAVVPQRGDPASTTYIYRTDDPLTLPYLPEPIVAGASLFGLPGHENAAFVVGYDGTWPLLEPFRIDLVEGPPGAVLTGGVLTVGLPKAERRRVRISSIVGPDALEHFAIWGLLSDAARAALRDDARNGRHWMLTPYRYLELVHAVQQPLVEPEVAFTAGKAAIGDTYAVFAGHVANHARSTGRIDVLGEWDEPVDRVTDPAADPVNDRDTGAAVAFGWDIGPGEDQAGVAAGRVSRHEFGDTKHRRVRYHAVATTRFREYFPPEITSIPAKIQRVGPDVELSVPNSARPPKPEVLYVVPTFRWAEEETSDGVRRRRLGKGVRAYLDRPWWSSGEGEQLGVVLFPTPRRFPIDVVARGEAVAVTTIGVRRRRVAGRAAGAGAIEHAPTDLVAAGGDVLAIVASGEFADPYVTKVGRDPTWATGAPKEVVRITDFALRTPQSRTGLSIAERDGARVAVAGHEVGWDDDRKLWYCDIELDPGPSYFPFVRLALARFQPESIAGAHLSPIVLTDFMQLTADRTAGLVRRSGQAVVTVTGLGPHNIVAEKVHPGPLGPTAPATNLSRTVTAVVQERDPSLPTDMGWSDVGKEQTLAVVGRRRGPERTWRGSLPLPDDLDTGTYRLLIREYESFFTDWDPEEHPPFSTTVPGTPVGFTRSRIVYADAFDLGP